MGHSDVEVSGRREGLDTAHGTMTAPQGRCDGQPASDDEAANGEESTERRRRSKGRNQETWNRWYSRRPRRERNWVNGYAKLKTWKSTIATAQNLLREWWGCGVDLRRRVADWAVHIFREHKEADFWAGKGVKGREVETTDTAGVIWSEVAGLCGFWDGSCVRGVCGAGTTIQVFTKQWAGLQFTKRTSTWQELPRCRIVWLCCVYE